MWPFSTIRRRRQRQESFRAFQEEFWHRTAELEFARQRLRRIAEVVKGHQTTARREVIEMPPGLLRPRPSTAILHDHARNEAERLRSCFVGDPMHVPGGSLLNMTRPWAETPLPGGAVPIRAWRAL